MALSRRTGHRFQGAIWPGFVDAMTGLLMVLMFVLTIFMMVQFVLRETISGQENELGALSSEVRALADALGVKEREASQLQARLGALGATLNAAQSDLANARAQIDQQQAAITGLTSQRDQAAADLDAARSRITSFEAQVAALVAGRETAEAQIAELTRSRDALEASQAEALSERDALNLALAQSREEIDVQTEAARLAAAKTEALQALVADLQDESGAKAAQVAELEDTLSAKEAARLAEAAAAQALRERLQDADAELTAMTLSLEAERKAAEDTLTLLAAAETARKQLNGELEQALATIEQAQAVGQDRDALAERLNRVLAQLDESETAAATRLSDLETQLAQAQAELAATKETADATATAAEEARASVEARLLAALDDLERAQAGASDQDVLQSRLLAALAAKDDAETQVGVQSNLAEQRADLLAQARAALSTEKAVSEEARRETALLNQQVAALRQQLGGLQALLDDFQDRDVAQSVQLQNLGKDLNAALARAAAEERSRRLLEEKERKRLEREQAALRAEAESLETKAENLEQYRSEFFGRLREVLGNQDGVRIEGDRFVFASEVLFGLGSATLSEDGKREIAKVARILQSIAADIPDEINWIIRVDGHTDNQPIGNHPVFADNWELSQGRALSVVRFMIDSLGIPPNRLAANGFGEFQPVNTDDTPEARAQNRRIELKLTER